MFKVGEKIECVKDNNNVTIGSTYKVVDVSGGVVGIINDVGSKDWYYTNVFKKYSNEATNPEEYVELDLKIYGSHKLREDIDEVLDLKHGYTEWQKVNGSRGCSIESYVGTSNRKVRCKRKHLPEPTTLAEVTKPKQAVAKTQPVLSVPAEDMKTQQAVAKPQPEHIAFDGAGRYRLKNGCIVNLDERRVCLKSDKIVSSNGNIGDWTWNSDGSITPIPLFSKEFYLAEKIAPESIDKVAKQLKSIEFTEVDDLPVEYTLTNGIKRGTTDFVGGSVGLDGMAYSAKDAETVKSLLANNAGRGMMDIVWASEPSARSEKSLKMDQAANLDGTMDVLLGSETSVSDINNVLKGNDMKEIAIKVATKTGKFLVSAVFKIVKYFLTEPAITLGKPVVNSVRYVMFLGGLATIGYGLYQPAAVTAAKDAVSDVFWSCMPTISIEGPAILRDTHTAK